MNTPTKQDRRPAAALIAAMAAALWAGTAAGAARVDRPAPDCDLNLRGAGSSALERFRGKVVYVDFWASWCAPCAVSFPFMNRLDKDLRGKGLQILAINMDKSPADADRFLSRHPASFAVAVKGNEACARAFGVEGMPASFLIDRKGVIRNVHEGFREGEAAQIQAVVERALADGAGK